MRGSSPETWCWCRGIRRRCSRAACTITGGAESITLVGRQSGPKIEGDVTNGNCGLHFTVAKRP
jgi:hypothetical protein